MTSDEARFQACMDMIRRTGAVGFQMRYEESDTPTVWLAIGEWSYKDGRPVPEREGGETVHEVAAALTPEKAVFRLLERAIDGGQCVHCGRPTGVTLGFDPVPFRKNICWYQFDPELKTFRRDCEGK